MLGARIKELTEVIRLVKRQVAAELDFDTSYMCKY